MQRERQEEFALGRAGAVKSLSDTVFMPSSEPGCKMPPSGAAMMNSHRHLSARHCAGLH